MPNIRPVSDLRNYAEVLKEISVDEPVFLTKNGRGRYAIVDIEEYEKTKAIIKLMSKLAEAEKSVKENDWLSNDDVKAALGVWVMEIRITPSALNDLKEIKSYIENDLSNPIAASNVIKRIIEDYSRLEVFPHMGPSLSTKISVDTDYRFIVSGNYLVFYKADDEYVSIYRILYGRRDYLKIIFDDIELKDEE